MFAFCHRTDLDHSGAVGEEVTEDQVGSPERLAQSVLEKKDETRGRGYLMEVTSHPRETAALQMRLPGFCQLQLPTVGRETVPRKPFPPQTTNFFFTACAILQQKCPTRVALSKRELQLVC
jgi:hypothetical protein